MSTKRDWREILATRQDAGFRFCGGLDLSIGKLSTAISDNPDGQKQYARLLIDATAPLCGAFKPNMAFYAGTSMEQIKTVQSIVSYSHAVAPEVPVIVDCKVGDIDATNHGYVELFFDTIGADAITLHPFMGRVKGMQPFLDRADKGCIVLCRTSNKGGAEYQDLMVQPWFDREDGQVYSSERHFRVETEGRDLNDLREGARMMRLFEFVAHRVNTGWNTNNNCALVAGATMPDELAEIRRIFGGPLLIPGVGKQGGDLDAAVRAAAGGMFVVNSSSGFAFAGLNDKDVVELDDYIEAARKVALTTHTDIGLALAA